MRYDHDINDEDLVVYFEDGNIIYAKNPNIKTPQSHPYSYDPFTTYKNHQSDKKSNGSVYSDRLLEWDRNKYDELCKKHFNNNEHRWAARNCDKIESFLRDWTDDQNLILLEIVQMCNVSSGFPVWCFLYYQEI